MHALGRHVISMKLDVGSIPKPLRLRAWVPVALVLAIGAAVLTAVLLTYLPVEDFAIGFHLDSAVPSLTSSPSEFERAAERFQVADPVADASEAIGAGDTRLWACKSHDGWFVPGGQNGRLQFYRRNYGLRFYQSGQVVHCESEQKFLQAIDAYAQRYNETVLQAVRP